MDQDRRKRTRDEDQGMNNFSENKRAKIRQEQGYISTNDVTTNATDLSSTSSGSPGYDHSDMAAQGVFDFPWMKDGVVSKSDQCREFEEDGFMSQLVGDTTSATTITTPAGIEFSFPDGQSRLCQTPVEAVLEFPKAMFDDANECLLIEDDGFETTESLDCILGALV